MLLLGPLGVAALLVLFLLGTPAGNDLLLPRLLPLLQPPSGTIEVGRLRTSLGGSVVIDDVSIRDAAGRELYGADRLSADLRLGALVGRRVVVDRLAADGLRVGLREGDTCLDPAAPWDDGQPPGPSTPWTGLGVDLDVRAVDLRATEVLLCAGLPLTGAPVTLSGQVRLDGPRLAADARLQGVITEPAWGALDLALRGEWDGQQVLVDHLDLALGPHRARAHGAVRDLTGEGAFAVVIDALSVEPAAFGAPQVRGALGLSGELTGAFATPALHGALSTPGGPAAVVASLDLSGEKPTWAITLDTPGLALHSFLEIPETVVAGRYTATGAGFGWPDDLDAALVVDGYLPVAGAQPGPFTVQGTATLHQGAVSLAGLTATAPGARVGLDGVVRVLDGGGTVFVREVEVDLARLGPYGAPGLTGVARFTGAVELDWEVPDVRFRGILRASGVGAGGARVARVAGPAAGQYRPEGVRLEATLDLGGVVAPGVEVAEARVVADVGRAASGSLSGSARVDARGLSAPPYALDAVWAAVGLAGDEVRVEAAGTTGERERVALAGRYDLGDAMVDLDRLRVAPGQRAWAAEGPVHLRLTDGGVSEARVTLVSGEARVSASGAGSAQGPLDLAVAVERLPLDAVPDLYPGALAGWLGVVDATATLGGTGRAPAVVLDGSVRGLTIPDQVRALDASLSARTDPAGVRLDARAHGPRGELATLSGTAPLFLDADRRGLVADAPVGLTLFVPPGDGARFEAVVPGLELGALRASAEVTLGGTLDDPALTVVASALRPIAPGQPWLGVDLDAAVTHGELSLRSVVRERLARRAEVTGSAKVDLARVSRTLRGEAPAWERINEVVTDLGLDVVPLQLPIEALAPEGLAGLTGDLLGGIRVSGDPLSPRVEGAVLVLGGKVGRVALSSAMLEIQPRPGLGYGIKLDLGMGREGGLTVAGTIPWPERLDGDVDAALARPGLVLTVKGAGTSDGGAPLGIPLAVLEGVVPGLEGAVGRLEVSGGIIGSLAQPVPSLDLAIRDGALSLRDTGVRYHGVTLVGSVEETAVRVSSLYMETDPIDPSAARLELDVGRREGEHDVSVRGVSVALDAWTPGAVTGTVDLLRARILDLPTRRVRVTGRLGVSGTWPQIALRGDLGVDRGYVSLSESFFTRTDELGLDPEIVVVRPGALTGARAEEGGFPLPDLGLDIALNRAVDIDVTMPTEQLLGTLGSTLSNVRVEATLDGEVELDATSGEIALSGAVETLRGTTTVLGKPFELRSGTVAFPGREWADPSLALSAEYASGGYGTIQAEIQGTARSPSIALSGEGGLSSDDAIAVLLFGAPLSSSSGGSTDALVGMLFTGLTSDLREVGSATALDVVELGLQGSTRVGKRLGRNVLVLLMVDPTPDEGESPLVVSMELQLPRRWFMVADYGSLGDTRISAVRKWRF